jgi:hypothetical protein
MKNLIVIVFVCIFSFSIYAEEEYEVVVKPGTCAPGQENMEMVIEREGQEPVVKIVPCPKVPEEVPEIPTVVRLIGEKTEKNYFFGSISYRFAHEEGLDLHVPVFSGGFQSYPFIKERMGVKISLGYGIPSNDDGFRHMLQWQLMTFIKSYKDIFNVNIGYGGSISWGTDSLSRNESNGVIEMEYFILKNLSMSFGVFLGGAQDSFYDPNASWKLSSGIVVSTTARF